MALPYSVTRLEQFEEISGSNYDCKMDNFCSAQVTVTTYLYINFCDNDQIDMPAEFLRILFFHI